MFHSFAHGVSSVWNSAEMRLPQFPLFLPSYAVLYIHPSSSYGSATSHTRRWHFRLFMYLSLQLDFELIESRNHFLIIFICPVVIMMPHGVSYGIQFHYVRVGWSSQLPENTWSLNSVIHFIDCFPRILSAVSLISMPKWLSLHWNT